MRALVTGGRGFVGRWLAEHLEAEGDEVAVIDRETDVTEPEALAEALGRFRPDAIYHLAALTHVGASWDAPLEVLRVNVLGTASVLAAARRLGDPLTLVVSSAEVYGAVRAEDLPVGESQPLAPLSPYAASKAASEQVALQAWRGFGQRVVVARPFNHIGPGQPPAFAVSALARRIAEARRHGRETLAVGNLSARRDFTDVRDVVRAYRLLVLHAEGGEVVNVCTGHDVAIAEVADRLLEAAGADLRFEIDPSLLRPVDVPVVRGSPARLQAITGWKPEVPLDETLRDVLGYWSAAT